MKLHELRPAKGSTHKEKRIGRGEGSGYGGTSTKGNKGGQSRAGYKRKMAHEGGQMPIQRRVPKRGFKNPDKIIYKIFNVGQFDHIAEVYGLNEFSFETLYSIGAASKTDRIKILANGELKGKFSFTVHAISEKAKSLIEASGSTVEILK